MGVAIDGDRVVDRVVALAAIGGVQIDGFERAVT